MCSHPFRAPLNGLLLALCAVATACGGEVAPPNGAVVDGGNSPTDAGPDSADASSDGPTDGGLDPRFKPLIAAIEQDLVASGAPGVAVAVLEGGEISFAAGFGSKHPDYEDPVLATTLFRIGSVTKMLTAAGVLQQVEAGGIALESPITDYLPDFDLKANPDWAPAITVKHLLTHTSGLFDYVDWEVDVSEQQDSALHDFLLGPYEDIGYVMAPSGRMYNYTNPGFDLAGLVLETVSGSWYREVLRDELFVPLGMTRTLFLPADVVADGDFAYGDTLHLTTGLPLVVAPHTFENGWQRPAGYVFSSVLDMAGFVKFLRTGNEAVLADEFRVAMQSPQIDTERFLDRSHYGFGIGILQGIYLGDAGFYELTLLSHTGGFRGFHAELYYVPELDFGLVTLANADDASFSNSLVTALTTLCTLPSPATAPDIMFKPGDYDSYVGSYNDPFLVGDIAVTPVGTELRADIPGLDAAAIPYEPVLVPLWRHNFTLTIEGYPHQITFILDADGTPEFFRTRYFVGNRISANP